MRTAGRVMFENRLWKLQSGCCAICGDYLLRDERFRDDTGWNLDHVYPRSRYARLGNRGNLVLTHVACNTAKADKEPRGCESIMLHAVNARMGHKLTEDVREYRDSIEAPSVLAVKLARALQAA